MHAFPSSPEGWQASPDQPRLPPPPLPNTTASTNLPIFPDRGFSTYGASVGSGAAPDGANLTAPSFYSNPNWANTATNSRSCVRPPPPSLSSNPFAPGCPAPPFSSLYGASARHGAPFTAAGVWDQNVDESSYGDALSAFRGHPPAAPPSRSAVLSAASAGCTQNENEEEIADDERDDGRTGAEEDEQRRGGCYHRGRQQEQQRQSNNDDAAFFDARTTLHTRLHLNPLVASANFASPSYASTDPITAALARQQQQLYNGEPRSPLSPRTLQALCSASAEGRQHSFLAQLTPDDVLAPPPLALTWYPAVPPGVTQHPNRKRRLSGEATTYAMARHEIDRLQEEGEDAWEGGNQRLTSTEEEGQEDSVVSTDVPMLPLRRARFDPTATSTVAAATGSTPSSADFTRMPPDTTTATSKNSDSRNELAAPEGSKEAVKAAGDASTAGGARTIAHAGAHQKRERSERVYEYMSHGRRLN
ncbi:hypothetical protein ABB37_06351 [Leptomonas pyrrhocoris]|uniref:Uncharacterized protein n=1 Tax=Leptomonas pyrrhocoris TaxID=157538 RepID=A0A0N0DU02_LEPPY|nr:hypothetical protein ABB37_06351 [Leptomonas pyrrhocoris]XP_015656624.1 hypothetical protein ABB37_06351 [Leptomonas pyrrhocoris]KPA78184.1 hypothetical protein ABB37_06351 [Leptomonas pyrrhocoris]KPA78185.1 hypothetical protein ABB37_06351 [Leptomonas pyrrhocoris]|eukprot:XP_015656623.1 hypothetical protein ABB37_06351 [Leptomonas pyrrhocoris]